HPEWIDFPREGNNWSYQYAQRQWSLVDNPELKYQFLSRFDAAMLKVIAENKVFEWEFGNQLNMDENNRTIIFERNQLVFVFNWHISNSIMNYEFMVPQAGKYKIILDSDNEFFGGHGRVDNQIVYETFFDDSSATNRLRIYNTNRTALIFKRI
ncbi:MAG: alpha amylase C-terminal domain-containing protein, partial [Bacteroidales bacterium]|nr:alpha amylase C-terminal domain-containing protein [Bacteroidales bacterium]